MNFLKLILLLVVAGLLAGCASTADESDYSPAQESAPAHDDSHGWGANVQGLGGSSH